MSSMLTRLQVASAQESTPGAGFPLTITHALGETVIEAAPERIVTLSWINQDIVIALGKIPVGVPLVAWGADESGLHPWTHAALGDAELPVLLETDLEIPFEAIVELDPDVILAVYSGITADEYQILSGIAPTVAYPEAPFATSWEEATTIIGDVLGLPAEAAALIDETHATLASASVDHPQIEGKTFVYGNVSAESFFIYTATDIRVQLLASMGMVPSQYVLDLSEQAGPDAFYVEVSLEEADKIDGDIVVFWFGSQEEADAAAAMPMVQLIPAFQNGTYVAIVGQPEVMASSAPSPLSIPFIIDTYVPLLAAAADNVTA
jgi:iron complex transport system substrate-binding protein